MFFLGAVLGGTSGRVWGQLFLQVVLNIVDFLKGKKTVVEGAKKRPVGRPRKRPDGILEAIKQEIPGIQAKLAAVAKPEQGAVEVEGSDSKS